MLICASSCQSSCSNSIGKSFFFNLSFIEVGVADCRGCANYVSRRPSLEDGSNCSVSLRRKLFQRSMVGDLGGWVEKEYAMNFCQASSLKFDDMERNSDFANHFLVCKIAIKGCGLGATREWQDQVRQQRSGQAEKNSQPTAHTISTSFLRRCLDTWIYRKWRWHDPHSDLSSW